MANLPRKGRTIIEVLVVCFLGMVAFALLLVGTQSARESSKFLEGQNRLRQIGVAVQNYSSTNNGKIPRSNLVWEIRPILDSASPEEQAQWENQFRLTTAARLLPYLESESLYRSVFMDLVPPEKLGHAAKDVQVFNNPLDQSRPVGTFAFRCSYAANAFLFSSLHSLGECTDGLSNTMSHSEHQRFCGAVSFNLFDIHNSDRYHFSRSGMTNTAPTFADSGYSHLHPAAFPNADFYPITRGDPPTSRASVSKTFQVQPASDQCDSRLLNSSSSRGLQVLMADGSSRVLGNEVKETTFWALVTPKGSELADMD